jgi:hypothetical protein
MGVALGEAQSYHLAVSLADESLRLGRWSLTGPMGDDISTTLESKERTPELLTLYTSVEDRPLVADLSIRVRVAREVSAVTYAVLGLCLLTVYGAMTGSAVPDRLGVMAVPTTFAVALLQIRERVSLVSRLQRFWSVLMILLLVVLWITVVVRLNGSVPVAQEAE